MRNENTKQRIGRLVIISAPSGGGKTSVVQRLLAMSRKIRRSVSYTTRLRRPGERHKRDYWFVTRATFLAKQKKGFFLEWAKVFNQYYGTSSEQCRQLTESGFDVILAIDVQGMRQIKRKFRRRFKIVTIFLKPPSIQELKKRLVQRKTDSDQEIKLRLGIAKKEIQEARRYDYVLVNQKLEETVQRILKLLQQ